MTIIESIHTSLAISFQPTVFSAVLFAGRLEEGFQAATLSGFSAIEIGMRDPADVDVKYLSKKIDKYNLKLSAIATGQSYVHDSLYLFCQDHDQRIGAARRINRFIEIASEFGAFVIIGGIRGKLSSDPQEAVNQRQHGLEIIRDCAQYAETLGVTLLLEPINRYETNIVNTADDGIKMLTELGVSNVKLLLDTFHMNIEEQDICRSIEMVGSRLGYIHFADSNRKAPGQGHIPFPGILETLRRNEYRGYISAEILPLPDDATAAKLAGEYLSDLIQTNV